MISRLFSFHLQTRFPYLRNNNNKSVYTLDLLAYKITQKEKLSDYIA